MRLIDRVYCRWGLLPLANGADNLPGSVLTSCYPLVQEPGARSQ